MVDVRLRVSMVNYLFIDDGFVKSPSAALRFIPALLNSRYARRRSRFNRVNHCDVLQVRLISQDSPALHLELFTVPSVC
jgi:hypothetical protein